MRLILDEQDIIDASCVFDAARAPWGPEDVDVELLWDERKGFAAEIDNADGRRIVHEQWLVDAICFWLSDFYSYNPEFLSVELVFEGAVGAVVNVGR